jgi:hypothetical protein
VAPESFVNFVANQNFLQSSRDGFGLGPRTADLFCTLNKRRINEPSLLDGP